MSPYEVSRSGAGDYQDLIRETMQARCREFLAQRGLEPVELDTGGGTGGDVVPMPTTQVAERAGASRIPFRSKSWGSVLGSEVDINISVAEEEKAA